jgi:gluconokinase
MRIIVVLMGLSGSGKTTIGELLADRMGAIFTAADDYHSAANKAKMAGGSH